MEYNNGESNRKTERITGITESEKPNKRFQVILQNGKIFHFGQKDPKYGTYIDHKNKDMRFRYWARHYGNAREKYLIDNLIPSRSLYSAYLLWGKHTDIKKNIKALNTLLKKGLTPKQAT
jgi:hypothetical protein